jgi:hypothetical protein
MRSSELDFVDLEQFAGLTVFDGPGWSRVESADRRSHTELRAAGAA